MSKPKSPSDQQLIRAAELRAQGISWAVIGRELNRKPETIQSWEQLFPEQWKRHYRLAMKRTIREVTAESVTALRSDLRTDDDKARRDAATKLLRFGIAATKSKIRKPTKKDEKAPSSAGVRFAKYVESLTPDQLSNLIRDLGYVKKEPTTTPTP